MRSVPASAATRPWGRTIWRDRDMRGVAPRHAPGHHAPRATAVVVSRGAAGVAALVAARSARRGSHDELRCSQILDGTAHGLEERQLLARGASVHPPEHQVRELALDAFAADDAARQGVDEISRLGERTGERIDEDAAAA